MELGDLFDKNFSNKASVAISTIAVFAYLGVHPAYIAAVAIVEIVVQGYLDLKKNVQNLDT